MQNDKLQAFCVVAQNTSGLHLFCWNFITLVVILDFFFKQIIIIIIVFTNCGKPPLCTFNFKTASLPSILRVYFLNYK